MDLLDETNEMFDRREGKRPVFILVLCILTWVGCFFGLIYGMIQLYSYAAISGMSDEFESSLKSTGTFNYFAILYWTGLANVVSALVCSVGAIFMFRLKKFGFFIYLSGQLAIIGASALSMLSLSNEFGGMSSIIYSGVWLLFPIAFIIMYGAHLRHMK